MDDKQHKYVGVGQVGHGTKYEEKTGFTKEIIYDNEGNVTSYKESGTSREMF